MTSRITRGVITPLPSAPSETPTVLVECSDTAGHYTLIEMHLPAGAGPGPDRHFEEIFTVLEGEIEITFRGVKSVKRAGESIYVPASGPHRFRNVSSLPVRLLCMHAPSGQGEFAAVRFAIATRGLLKSTVVTDLKPSLSPEAPPSHKL